MAKRTIACRLNSSNKGDKEIMEWLDMMEKYHMFDNTSEAIKCAILTFLQDTENAEKEDNQTKIIQGFVKEYAMESRRIYEETMQEYTTKMLTGLVGTMSQLPHGQMIYPTMPLQSMEGATQSTYQQNNISITKEIADEATVLQQSNGPLEERAKASLAAMFDDDDEG